LPDTQDKGGIAAPSETAAIAVQPSKQTAAVAEHEITLTQFGIEFSKKERRVELLNAFIFTQRLAGFHKDVKSAYIGRFEAFVHQPADKG
jgi:hypothetical protein